MHDKVKVTNDQRKKPHVHVMYNHTKGGVDIVDLLSRNHSTRIKSRRWPLNALAFVLDTCRTNPKRSLGDNNIKVNNFEFTYELGKALVLSSIYATIWKFKQPSDQNLLQNEACFEYPRSKPPATNWKSKNKKWTLLQVCRWNCWYSWLEKQTRETKQQFEIEMSHV